LAKGTDNSSNQRRGAMLLGSGVLLYQSGVCYAAIEVVNPVDGSDIADFFH
jgi:hypothetical protein